MLCLHLLRDPDPVPEIKKNDWCLIKRTSFKSCKTVISLQNNSELYLSSEFLCSPKSFGENTSIFGGLNLSLIQEILHS